MRKKVVILKKLQQNKEILYHTNKHYNTKNSCNKYKDSFF